MEGKIVTLETQKLQQIQNQGVPDVPDCCTESSATNSLLLWFILQNQHDSTDAARNRWENASYER